MNSVQSISPWASVMQTKEDIVKADGDTLKVQTNECVGTEFTIILPL